jgi:hypothetical protein
MIRSDGSALIQIRSQLFQVLLHHPVKDPGKKEIVIIGIEIDVLVHLMDLRTSSDHVKMHIEPHMPSPYFKDARINAFIVGRMRGVAKKLS